MPLTLSLLSIAACYFVVSTQDLYRGNRTSGRSQDIVSETTTIGLVGLVQVSEKTYPLAPSAPCCLVIAALPFRGNGEAALEVVKDPEADGPGCELARVSFLLDKWLVVLTMTSGMVMSLPAKKGPVGSASLMKVSRVLRNSDLTDSRLYGFSGVCWRKRWKAAVASSVYEDAECGWCRVEDDSAMACWCLCVWHSLCMTHFTAVELCYVEVYTCRSLDATMISRALTDSSLQATNFVRTQCLREDSRMIRLVT